MISNLTAYDIISKALRVVGVVGLGDPINALVAQEALMILNGIRKEWSLNVKNWSKYDKTYAATVNKQFITLGTNGLIPGDIATRPNTITDVILINGMAPASSNNNFKLALKPYEAYRELVVQNINAMPDTAYLDYEYPLMNVYFNPGLSAGWSVRVMGNSYMEDYENIGDQFMDPTEYFDALYLALATRLAPLHGFSLPPDTVIQASSAIKHIKHHLAQLRRRKMPNQISSQGTGFNFYAGR